MERTVDPFSGLEKVTMDREELKKWIEAYYVKKGSPLKPGWWLDLQITSGWRIGEAEPPKHRVNPRGA